MRVPRGSLPVLLAGVACGDEAVVAPPRPPPPAAATVAVTPGSVEFTALGDTARLTARVLDRNGQTIAGATVTWTSRATAVATVGATGLVTATGNGVATVTATSGPASGDVRVTVEQRATAVRLSPSSLALLVGDTASAVATAMDALGNEIPEAEFDFLSSDTTVATVDTAGLVHARAVGTATVTAASGDLRDSAHVSVLSNPAGHHAALTAGLPERPFVNTTVGGNEGSTRTVGTLGLDLNPSAFPVIVMPAGSLIAGSFLGSGRVVAFSGQDFLGSDARATLVGHEHVDRLLANAVRWTAGGRAAPLRVLADNQRIAGALEAQGLERVDVVGRRGRAERDWNAGALDDTDVAVVQVNQWGTAHLGSESLTPLRAFVERGGGLVIAGSALHWDWWIAGREGPFAGNVLLRGTGISWNEDSIDDIEAATTELDSRTLPGVVWASYLRGDRLDATQLAMLPGLFSAALELGRRDELDRALVRLVSETPPLPVSADAPEARLATGVASSLGAHEWPETHPWATTFPGLPAPGARRVSGSVVVDATWAEFPHDARRRERHVPLGFYAPPGGVVTILVPSSHATGRLAIEVGQEHNDLRPLRDRHPEWRRAPALQRTFSVVAAETAVTNAYGGSISIVIPESYRGSIPVTIQGAIPMAVYTAGESNGASWRADLDAGAPQAIIEKSGGIRFVISAESARGIADPGEVSVFWDGFQRHHAELAGEPVPRAYESTWIFDPQVGYGYANAGWLTINYPLHAEAWALVPGTAEGRAWIATLTSGGPRPFVRPPPEVYSPWAHGVNWWLFGHELGHQWQTEDWTGHGITEVGVNLFTMYTLNYYLYGGDDFNVYTEQRTHGCAAPVDHAAIATLRWSTAGACERLFLYRQLIDRFGWDPMKRVFHSYYDPAYPRSTYDGELDGFAIRFSAIVQRDLVDFFRHWEYPLSDSAAAAISGFGFEKWLPPGW